LPEEVRGIAEKYESDGSEKEMKMKASGRGRQPEKTDASPTRARTSKSGTF